MKYINLLCIFVLNFCVVTWCNAVQNTNIPAADSVFQPSNAFSQEASYQAGLVALKQKIAKMKLHDTVLYYLPFNVETYSSVSLGTIHLDFNIRLSKSDFVRLLSLTSASSVSYELPSRVEGLFDASSAPAIYHFDADAIRLIVVSSTTFDIIVVDRHGFVRAGKREYQVDVIRLQKFLRSKVRH